MKADEENRRKKEGKRGNRKGKEPDLLAATTELFFAEESAALAATSERVRALSKYGDALMCLRAVEEEELAAANAARFEAGTAAAAEAPSDTTTFKSISSKGSDVCA